MLKNLINEVLSNEGMSINQLSQKLGMTYANAHSLVNREDLSDTKLGTLVDVARILDVEVNDLFEVILADPYDFREVKILDEAISLVEINSNTGSASEKTYEEFNRLKDDIEEYGELNNYLVDVIKKEILNSAEYAGYTNIQHNLIEKVKRVLKRLDYKDVDTCFNKNNTVILIKGNGGYKEYNYDFFKEGFEEWCNDLDVSLANADQLQEYLTSCGYKVLEIIE